MKTLKGRIVSNKIIINSKINLLLNNHELMEIIRNYSLLTDSRINILIASDKIELYIGLSDSADTMELETYLTDYVFNYYLCEVADNIGVIEFEKHVNEYNKCLCVINKHLDL